jgi:death-on-curing protein
MISEADILLLHEFSILDYGGAKEVRERSLLLSAISRPFHTFDGIDLYPNPFEKAAALGESLITNHPFVDGNKRTAFLAMAALLSEYGFELDIEKEKLYDFILEMSMGKKQFIEIVDWLKGNCKERSNNLLHL